MSAFTTVAPEFESFLLRIKDDPALAPHWRGASENARFIPRNFLLEERLHDARRDSYLNYMPPGAPRNFQDWLGAHNDYLKNLVFRKPIPKTARQYQFVSKDDPDACPETFRLGSAMLRFQDTDLDTYLIRLVPVADIASLAGKEELRDKIFSWGQQVASDPTRDTPERQELEGVLEAAYHPIASRCDHRPIFAAFYDDFYKRELADPTDTTWADKLRDRLGAIRLNQFESGGLPHAVFLFKYQVRDLPLHPGHDAVRPLAVPIVTDHQLSEVFCPAPLELDRGRIVNLEADSLDEPAREVLHLFMPMRAEQLIRAGLVTQPVPENLRNARRDHLVWMQLSTDRSDYASSTDSDVLT